MQLSYFEGGIRPAFDKDNVLLVTSSRDSFIPYVGVLLHSIIENSTSRFNYDFVVLHDGVKVENQRRICAQAKGKGNFSVRFFDVGQELDKYELISYAAYVPKLTCARLMIPELFPYSGKAVWIDADTIVEEDIAELYNIDIGANMIGAAVDVGMAAMYNTPGSWSVDIIDNVLKLKPYTYFNAGIIILNCNKFRSAFTTRHVLETAARKDFKFLDQDALNYLCKNQVHYVDLAWNFNPNRDDYKTAPARIANAYEAARAHPKIIHFVGDKKPGHYPEMPMADRFWGYANKTEFARDFFLLASQAPISELHDIYIDKMWKERERLRVEFEKKIDGLAAGYNINGPKKGSGLKAIGKQFQTKRSGALKKRFKSALKTCLRPVADIFRKIVFKSMRDVIAELKESATSNTPIIEGGDSARACIKLLNEINWAQWEQLRRIDIILNYVAEVETSRIPYLPGEKIRILFLFQAAPFWPNIESLYESCMTDPEFDVKLALLEADVLDGAHMKTARAFAEKSGLKYEEFSIGLIESFRPHVTVLQSPYDEIHRPGYARASTLRKLGTRIAYIPYGIELSDTEQARNDHFLSQTPLNAWRIYTFSKLMKRDYYSYSKNPAAVRSYGPPKFDSLFKKEKYPLPQKIASKAYGRKIILWHAHFPKTINENGQEKRLTPQLSEYSRFVDYISTNDKNYFIFMPHPKFFESETEEGRLLLDKILKTENISIDTSDDYRHSLYNSDCIISDRSAILIEAGGLGVPVLYLTGSNYHEPATEAIEPLLRSYYHGDCCADMINFINMFNNGEDPRKFEREAAFSLCIPDCDGLCGHRIAEDIKSGVKEEHVSYICRQIESLSEQSSEIIAKLDEFAALMR